MANCTNLIQQWLRHVAICKLHRSGGYAHTLMDSAKSKSETGRGLRHVAKVLCCVVKQTAVAMQKNSDLGTGATNLGSGAPPFLAGTRVSVLTRLTDAMLASSLVPVQHASLAPLAHVGSALIEKCCSSNYGHEIVVQSELKTGVTLCSHVLRRFTHTEPHVGATCIFLCWHAAVKIDVC